jgi:hypothetical protein
MLQLYIIILYNVVIYLTIRNVIFRSAYGRNI